MMRQPDSVRFTETISRQGHCLQQDEFPLSDKSNSVHQQVLDWTLVVCYGQHQADCSVPSLARPSDCSFEHTTTTMTTTTTKNHLPAQVYTTCVIEKREREREREREKQHSNRSYCTSLSATVKFFPVKLRPQNPLEDPLAFFAHLTSTK